MVITKELIDELIAEACLFLDHSERARLLQVLGDALVTKDVGDGPSEISRDYFKIATAKVACVNKLSRISSELEAKRDTYNTELAELELALRTLRARCPHLKAVPLYTPRNGYTHICSECSGPWVGYIPKAVPNDS